MSMDMVNPVAFVQERLSRHPSLDDQALTCVGVLADRLAHLKRLNPAFEAITLSPELEAALAAQAVAAVN